MNMMPAAPFPNANPSSIQSRGCDRAYRAEAQLGAHPAVSSRPLVLRLVPDILWDGLPDVRLSRHPFSHRWMAPGAVAPSEGG